MEAHPEFKVFKPDSLRTHFNNMKTALGVNVRSIGKSNVNNLNDYALLPMATHGIHATRDGKQLVNMIIVPPPSDDMVVQVSKCNNWLLFKFTWPSIVSDPTKLMQIEEAMSKQPGFTPFDFSQAAAAHLMSLREKRPLVSLYKVPTPFKVATKIIHLHTFDLSNENDGENVKVLWIMGRSH